MALTRITGTVIKDGGLQNADLPDSGVTANSYGSGTAIPVLTVNSKGIVTSVTTTSVAGVSSLSWDTGTEVLTLSTADGGSYTADLSGMASQSYVDTAINNLIAAAPGTLNTLDELAAALGDDANFASTVTTSLAGKVDKINITGATVGSASQVPVITFNAQGQITSATSTAVAGVSALSYNQSTGVLTIDTADGGQFTTDIIVGQDDQPEFTNIFINDTGSTLRGIARTNAGYNLNIMGGADQTDGAMITVNGGQRGGAGNAANASLEFYTGSDYAASQSAVVGDYYFKTQWLGNSKTLMQIDSSTGYVGINTVGAPTATLDVGGNIAVTGTVDGRDITADGTKLDLINQGVATTDSPSFAGGTFTGDVSFGDNNKAVFGAGTDLEIYHDGVQSSYIKGNGGAHFLDLESYAVRLGNGTYTAITAINGVATLTHNNVSRLTTTSTGITVTGNITLSGTVDGRDIAADGTKLDGIESGATADQTKADIDALGINAATLDSLDSTQFLRSDQSDTMTGTLTATSYVVSQTDGGAFRFQTNSTWGGWARPGLQYEDGSGNDLAGVGAYGDNGTSLGYIYIGRSYGDYSASFRPDGAVTLSYDGQTKLATSSTGVNITGDVAANFFLSDTVINSSYTIPSGKNAMTAGPVTIADGVTITVPDGSTWTVV